jgi:DNA-binding FadR family transcriptional regulator
MFRTVGRTDAHAAIVNQVETAIAEGRLGPGDRLPGERQLMEEFGVSRPTIREAMRVLQATGIVESTAGLQKSLHRLSAHGGASRAQLLQFRLMLEGTATRLAARVRTEEDLVRIRAAHDALQRATERAEGFGRESDEFLAAVRTGAHNPLLQMCGQVFATTMRSLAEDVLARSADRRARLQVSAHWGRQVLTALEDGDSERAATAVVTGLYLYYADDLDEDERVALAPLAAGADQLG